MTTTLNLLEETISHFEEGARSVRAYSEERTYIITRAGDSGYFVALEAPGFPKSKVDHLEDIYTNVFGIEAFY